MSERQMRLRLGLFVLLSIFLMGALILTFGAFPTMFRVSNPYLIRFADAPGVAPGTPVRRSGVRVGDVRNVRLDEETGEVIVTVSVDPPNRIRRNEVPTLVTGLLGSDATIDFVPEQPDPGKPPPDRSPVPPGTELVGKTATVGNLLSRATDIVPTTQDTLNDMRKSLQRIEKMTPLVEETLKEFRDVARVAREMAPDVRRSVNEVGELAKSVREIAPEVRDLAKAMQQAIPDARKAIDDAAAASRNIGKLAERLDVFVQTNQDKVVKSIDLLNEAVQRGVSLLNDENLRAVNTMIRNARRASDSFESIATNVEQATKEAKEALQEGKDAVKEGKEAVKEGRESVRRFNLMLNRVDDILKNLQEATKPLAERSSSILKNTDESLEKLNRTLGDAGALFRVLDQSDGSFRKFLTDPQIFNRIDDILCGVQRMLPRVDRILRDAETFADKLARHPESLGIGGVVRPGSGLKEPPTPPGAFRGPR